MDGDVVEATGVIEEPGEDRPDARLARRRGQLQDPEVLDVGALAVCPHQGIVRTAERHRRIEVFAIAVPGEGAWFPHQPADHMPVVDAMLVLAPQARHRLHEVIAIANLDDIRVHARVDGVADQLRRHRVRPMRHANRAPPTHHGRVGREAGNRGGGQAPQRRALLGEAGGGRPIAPVRDHLLDERLVACEVVERRMAAHEQGLRHQRFQASMRLLRNAILVGAAGRDPTRADPIVLEHRPEPRRQRAATTDFQLVRRGRQIVAAQHGGGAAERPQRALDAGHERLEGLAKRHGHPGPMAVAENEFKQEMRQGLAGDRDAEIRTVREVDRGFAPRDRHLLEEHLRLDAVAGTPVAKSPLQRPRLAQLELVGIPLPEDLQHELRFEDALHVASQQRLHVRQPDRGKRIRARPPIAHLFRGRRDRPALPLASGPHTHTARGRRGRLGLAIHTCLPHEPHLRIRDH